VKFGMNYTKNCRAKLILVWNDPLEHVPGFPYSGYLTMQVQL